MTLPSSSPRRRGPSPSQLIVLSFLLAALLGGLLLALPFSHAPGQRVSLLEALFTATSAVCVTGLTVVDTGSAYSRVGQIIIMLLFQVGGLGILTLGALLVLATRRRVGFGTRLQLQAQLNALQVGGIVKLVRRIFLSVLVIELLGALLLYPRFAQVEGSLEGAFYALFHSISAFNNAGFGLYGDSLSRFVGDPLVVLSVSGLIIVGGLGFLVIFNLLGWLRHRRKQPLLLHSKLALATTALLLGVAFALLLALEWHNPATLASLSFGEKVLAGLFQAVTPRTAGFNTLDYSQMTSASQVLSMLLMFVGANPGSTGGGVKTVTFAVLLGSTWTVIRGRGELNLFGRRIRAQTVVRAGVISFTAAMTVGAAVTLLAMSEPEQGLLELTFESISAFATVGLSLGVTPELSALGKWVIIVLMFLGRVGFVTFALSLVEEAPERSIRYPEEEVVIG